MKEMLQTQNKDEQRDNGKGNTSQKRVHVNWAEAQFFDVRLHLNRERQPARVTRGQFSRN
jgi:hypothetical protein